MEKEGAAGTGHDRAVIVAEHDNQNSNSQLA